MEEGQNVQNIVHVVYGCPQKSNDTIFSPQTCIVFYAYTINKKNILKLHQYDYGISFSDIISFVHFFYVTKLIKHRKIRKSENFQLIQEN